MMKDIIIEETDVPEKSFDEVVKLKKQNLSSFDLERKLTELKKTNEYNWLNDYDTKSIALIMKDVQNAYMKFFDKLGF